MKANLICVIAACTVVEVGGLSIPVLYQEPQAQTQQQQQRADDGDLTITLLHTNDVHSRFQQSGKSGGPCPRDPSTTQCYGGVARRFTKIEEIRKTHDNVLLLDAGDQYQGTLWFVHYGGQAASHFMDLLKYDVMTLGNHEFDRGVVGLVPFIQNVSFPMVSSNIDSSEDPRIDGLFNRSAVFDIGGRKVGVIGVLTKDTPDLVNPDGVSKLVFKDEVESVRAEVGRLHDSGIGMIIALSHSGFTLDKTLAAQVDGLDVVIGGHSNTFLYTGTAPTTDVPVDTYPTWVTSPSGKKVAVVQDFAYGKYLGYLNVTFNARGEVLTATGNPILLDNSVQEDEDVLRQVEEWAVPLANISDTHVGSTHVYLEGSHTVCRLRECNMGNAMTDAMLLRIMVPPSGDAWSDISIAIWNSGGIRSSIQKGDITLEDVLMVFPFQNTISVITVLGKGLLQILEHSVANYRPEAAPGGFLQVSGLRVQYSLSRPSGARVVHVDVRCTNCSVPSFSPLDQDVEYDVATSDFLINGGDGYKIIKKVMINMKPFNILDYDAFGEYCTTRSPITQGLEDRVTFLDETSGAPSVVVGSMLLPAIILALYTGL